MLPTVIDQLHTINREFYQTFATQFSSTRMHIQVGVKRILLSIGQDAKILDLGCGNGEVALELIKQGFHGEYTGIDFSEMLLDLAQKRISKGSQKRLFHIQFIHADLLNPQWIKALPKSEFDQIIAFAVLHHIPSYSLRLSILKQVKQILFASNPNSSERRFIHSVWQFQNNIRIYRRIIPWETIGLSINDLEPGDFLLDWRHGGYALRYVHLFDENELNQLANNTGFKIRRSFYSDGHGSKQSIYQVWEPRKIN